MKELERILIKIFIIIAGVMFMGLTLTSFFISYINTDLRDEHVYRINDNLILNVVAIAIIFTGMVFAKTKLEHVKNKININVLAILLSFTSIGLSILWVLGSGTEVQADQWKICQAAADFNKGNYQWLEKGEYVAECPHQLGIITLIRIIFFVFGEWNYLPFQILSCISVGLIIYFIYRFALEITDNWTVSFIALLLAFLCLPLYFYTPFVYGELLSIALSLIVLFLYARLMKAYRHSDLVTLLTMTTMMLLVRKNTIIILVAILGVSFVKLITNHRKRNIAIILAVVMGILLKSVFISALYDSHIPEDATEIPSSLYVAMGTNNNDNHSGWFNGLHHAIFEANEFDPVPSSEQGKQIVSEFLKLCVQHPVGGAKFYFRKIATQWSAPMYQCIVMNNNVTGNQSALARFIYFDDKAWKLMDGYMNIYQLLLYISITVALFIMWNRNKKLELYTGLIAVYGGFLFSIIWEAKTRYVFPYMLIMIPYMAYGIYLLTNKIDGLVKAHLSRKGR
ncbi:glycosyltransferase family protein [Pseudobutyrivibrio xylanivorans]|nr:hypothetical protein [Pseudobutyrivibrio xylanivorans]